MHPYHTNTTPSNRNTCIIITGQTASGKTSLAIQLARHFNTSIISADSRQCFRELSIGVAKPSAAQLREITHYFIDTHSITEDVNAALFEKYALNTIQQIFDKNNTTIMAGGTGLYIKAFCEGLDNIPPVPESVRHDIVTAYEQHGLGWLQNQVKEQDPHYYASAELENPQRLIRALEVKMHTGQSIRHFQEGKKIIRPFNIVKIGIELPRAVLYERINQRVDDMMNEGLLEEVKRLFPFRHLNALQTVGYQELFNYLEGVVSLEKAVEQIKKNTRHYAKRQLTWFKRDESIHWFSPDNPNNILSFVSTFIQQ